MFFILIFLLSLYKKPLKRTIKKFNFGPLIPYEKTKENNPDINTKNLDLHKIRLIIFSRSQYKGLTFLLVQRIEFIIFFKKVIKFIANIEN